MANTSSPELVKALVDWMDANSDAETDWDEVTQAALAELELRHQTNTDELEDVAQGFKQGWRDMLNGNTIPASQLLDALNEES